MHKELHAGFSDVDIGAILGFTSIRMCKAGHKLVHRQHYSRKHCEFLFHPGVLWSQFTRGKGLQNRTGPQKEHTANSPLTNVSHLPSEALAGFQVSLAEGWSQELLGIDGWKGWLRLEVAFAVRLSAWGGLDMETVGNSAVLYLEVRNVNY